jgi:hypothetical protein
LTAPLPAPPATLSRALLLLLGVRPAAVRRRLLPSHQCMVWNICLTLRDGAADQKTL